MPGKAWTLVGALLAAGPAAAEDPPPPPVAAPAVPPTLPDLSLPPVSAPPPAVKDVPKAEAPKAPAPQAPVLGNLDLPPSPAVPPKREGSEAAPPTPVAERAPPPTPEPAPPPPVAASSAMPPSKPKLPAPEAAPVPVVPPTAPREAISLSKPRPLAQTLVRSPLPEPIPETRAEEPRIPAPRGPIRMDGSKDVIARSTLPTPSAAPPAKAPPAVPRGNAKLDPAVRSVSARGEPGGVVAAIGTDDGKEPSSAVTTIELVEPPTPKFQVVQVGADGADQRLDPAKGPPKTLSYGPAPEVNAYTIELWDIDGWESLAWLAKQRYRAADLAPALAKYNRWTGRTDTPLPRGMRVRLPPVATLEKLPSAGPRDPAVARQASLGGERGYLMDPEETRSLLGGQAVASSRAVPDPNRPPETAVAAAPPRVVPGALPAAAEPGPATRVSASPTRSAADNTFVVEDQKTTLYMVAKTRLGDAARKDELFRLNQGMLASPDDVLKIGTRLRLPDDAPQRR